MSIKNVIRIGLVLAILAVGSLLLIQRTDLASDTPERQQAVQRALAPGRQPSSSNNEVTVAVNGEESGIEGTTFEVGAPASVNILEVPTISEDELSMLEAWEAGLIDIGRIDSPFSDAVIDTLQAESAAQDPDPNITVIDNPDPDTSNSPTAFLKVNEFKSIDYNQTTGSVPPDPIITVGHKGIIAAVNTSFQGYDFLGNSLFGPLTFSSFWGSSCGTGAGVTFFDPFLEYDEENRRYIVGITAFDSTVNNGDNGWACIAISKTDDLVGDWWLYSVDGNPFPAQPDLFFDYPHLGVGQKGLYLEGNMFAGDTFQRSHIIGIDKVQMYLGNPWTGNAYMVNNHFTIQPSKIHGKTTGGWPSDPNEPHYYVSAATGNNKNTLTVWKFSDLNGPANSFTPAGTVTVDTYNMPLNQPQSGGNNVQANDNRMLDVKYWNGRLYATHTIGCNPGGGTVNCVSWYIIDMSSGSPVLLRQGRVASGTGDFGRFFPAIATNMCGDLLLGYSGSGPNHFPGAYVIGLKQNAGAYTTELAHKAGEVTYTAFDNPPHRWGDYTGMAIHPNGRSFFYLGQYSRNQANTRWSTWIGEYEWTECTQPPTPTPTATNTPISTSTPTPTPTNTSQATATATQAFTPTPTSTPDTNTMCSIYTSTDVPKTIPNNSTGSISSVLNVPSPGVITDVNVINLKGKHTWVQDLNFNLKSPQGTEIQVLDLSTCGDNLQDFDINLDDSAAANPPCPPVGGGTYKPTNLLSAFNGQEQAGTWTLRIEDTFSEDGGSLDSWGLYICKDTTQPTATATPTTPPDATATPTDTPSPTATNTSTPNPDATSTPTSMPRSTSTPTATPSPTITPGDDFEVYLPFINRP